MNIRSTTPGAPGLTLETKEGTRKTSVRHPFRFFSAERVGAPHRVSIYAISKTALPRRDRDPLFPSLFMAIVAQEKCDDSALGIPVDGDPGEAAAVGVEE